MVYTFIKFITLKRCDSVATATKKKKSTVKKNLVIVESPAKAKTIEKYLGRNYKVLASVGHIRDLKKSSMSVDIENNYEPQYINIRGKGPLINDLKKEAKKANKVFLASDPDREGEAISWHLAHILDLDENDANRVVFNEITKERSKKMPLKNAKFTESVMGIDTWSALISLFALAFLAFKTPSFAAALFNGAINSPPSLTGIGVQAVQTAIMLKNIRC